jgi:hypothetical protein
MIFEPTTWDEALHETRKTATTVGLTMRTVRRAGSTMPTARRTFCTVYYGHFAATSCQNCYEAPSYPDGGMLSNRPNHGICLGQGLMHFAHSGGGDNFSNPRRKPVSSLQNQLKYD